jgi:AraC family transcriptional regulator
VKTETRSFYEAAVVRALGRVMGSLDATLNLRALAREAALSPFHFHRIFRGIVGETPLELHRRLRLERAAAHLVTTDASITRLAFDAGYETHEAFTRAFRQAYGTSPSDLRQRAHGRPAGLRPLQTFLSARCGVHFGDSADAFVTPPSTQEVTMNVTIEDMPAIRVAAVRHVGAYNRIVEAFQRLGAIAAPAGLQRDDAMMLAIYHDDPETTPVEQWLSDACLSVGEGVALPEGVFEQRLTPGLYARTTHLGPYRRLGDTWSRLMGEWLPRSGQRVGSGWSYEVYRNNPQDTPQDDLRTDLYLPLAEAADPT